MGDDGTFELAPSPGGHQRNVSLARDAQGTFFAAWSDTRAGVEQTWFSRSMDEGATWSAAQPLAAGERQLRPSIAAGAANHVVVAWQELRAGREQIRLAEARDGATFSTRWVEESEGAQWEPERSRWAPSAGFDFAQSERVMTNRSSSLRRGTTG